MIAFNPDELAEMRAYDAKCEREPLSYAEFIAAQERDRKIKDARSENEKLNAKRKYNREYKRRKRREMKNPDDNASVIYHGVTMTYRERQQIYYDRRMEAYYENRDGRRDRALAYQREYVKKNRDRLNEMRRARELRKREERTEVPEWEIKLR